MPLRILWQKKPSRSHDIKHCDKNMWKLLMWGRITNVTIRFAKSSSYNCFFSDFIDALCQWGTKKENKIIGNFIYVLLHSGKYMYDKLWFFHPFNSFLHLKYLLRFGNSPEWRMLWYVRFEEKSVRFENRQKLPACRDSSIQFSEIPLYFPALFSKHFTGLGLGEK